MQARSLLRTKTRGADSIAALVVSYVAQQKQATVRRGTAAEVLAPLNTPPAPSSFPLLIVSGSHVIPI